MAIPILLFLVGLVFLIKGGDWFVDGATGIARRFHISELLIGATIVSLGTTLPEVMVSATSAVGGQSGIAYGNAVGSVICNTALIAAITIAFRPSQIDRKVLVIPVLFFLISSLVYCGFAYFYGGFPRFAGVILLLLLIAYLTASVLSVKKKQSASPDPEEAPDNAASLSSPLWKEILFLLLGAVLIAFGARLLVDNGTIIAQKLGVPETVIALTLVALGTSLPELVTAITSLVKGHGSLSLGNIIGANLLNLVLVSGLATTIRPFSLPEGSLLFGINSSLVLDLPVMMLVMGILTVPAMIRGKLSRIQGFSLLAIYAAFCVCTILL